MVRSAPSKSSRGRAWVLKALPPGTASLAAALITLIGMALLLAIGAPPAAAQEQTGGAVVAWGGYEGGRTTVPPGFESSMRAIDAGGWHSLALTDYGSVVA